MELRLRMHAKRFKAVGKQCASDSGMDACQPVCNPPRVNPTSYMAATIGCFSGSHVASCLLDLLQLRGVCKLWRSLVGSRIVSEAWSSAHCSRDGAGGEEGSGAAPWFVMGVGCSSNDPGVDDQFAAFDTASHRWVPFEAFLSSTCSEAALLPLGGPSLTRVLHSLPTFRAASFKAVGSDNGSGLVCFICRPAHTVSNDVPFSLVMLNPITGAHTILPHPSIPRPIFTVAIWKWTVWTSICKPFRVITTGSS
ncbi:hypothetical protein L7F22_011691 [Adiantum nelumboides]|nr:hypothetical protein [Adiantum nelumboides]